MLAVLGPLGSGKTTVLQNLLSRPFIGKVLLIVNDVGEINVDATRLQNLAEMRALTAGCIGCSDLGSFLEIIEEAKKVGIAHLIVEPTGIADGREIKDAATQADIQCFAATLVDFKHFERNRALGVMETQLGVADIIGVTWFDELLGETATATNPLLLDVLILCGHSAPQKKVCMVPKSQSGQGAFVEQVLAEYEKPRFLQKQLTPICSHCGHAHHAHHHHDSDHVHNHGVYAESGSLPADFGRTSLTALLAEMGNALVRAKGVVDGHSFDFTQGTLLWSNASELESHATFISTAPLHLVKVDGVTDGTKKQLMRGYQISPEATEAAILWQIAEYPSNLSLSGEIRVDCEADIVRQLCERTGVSAELRAVAIKKYVEWRLASLVLLNQRKLEWQEHPDFYYWQRRLGAVLAWHAVHCENEIGWEAVEHIRSENAAKNALEGLLCIERLSFDEERAEERPGLIADVIHFGLEHGNISAELAGRVTSRMKSLSVHNPDWHAKWGKVMASM